MGYMDEIVMTSVDGEELLPCPFCGGFAYIWQCGQNGRDPNDSTNDGRLYSVDCAICGVSNYGYFRKPKDALRAWNRRGQNSSRFLCEKETLNEENVYERQMTLFQECE
ncbi:MAG: hypothetical protein IJQ08_00700 [Synergistaceae bacterium]|nr:hypothetical protein [Synergistaceae bacterium]